MTTQPRVSVIVPVYNVEKYLRQCLDSIVGQTLAEIEILIVNDGSTDGSLEIIREYAEHDKRIKVIDKQNEGYGKSMNRGLDAALGEYIGIVEPDDWIEPDMYEALHTVAKVNDVDMARARHVAFDDTTGGILDESTLPEDAIGRVYTPRRRPSIFYSNIKIWDAVYRRKFLNDNEIRFFESPGASYQDAAFYFKVLAMADRAYLLDKLVVHYRCGHGTQSSQSREKVFCVCDEFNEVERYMREKNPERFGKLTPVFNRAKFLLYEWNYDRLDGENRKAFHRRITQEFSPVFERRTIDCSMLSSKEKLKLWKFVCPDSFLLKLRYVFLCISRVLIKDKIKDRKWRVIIFLGLMPVAKLRLKNSGIEE